MTVISERAVNSNDNLFVPPPLENDRTDDERGSLCCHSCFLKRLMDGNRNAIGFMLDSIAAALIYVGSGSFFISTLIKLAKNEAGCSLDLEDECNEEVHGMKPSSLLTTYATSVGMVAALLMPFVGAIVDTTPHRLRLGRIFATFFLAALFPTIFLNESNWFAMSIMFALVSFLGYFETMCLYSYLPELTNDEPTLNRYTRTISISSFSSMIVYLLLVVAIALPGRGGDDAESNGDNKVSNEEELEDDIRTARIAQSISFAISTTCFFLAWGFLLEPRPAVRTRRASSTVCGWLSSLWQASFVRLYHTAVKVHRQHRVLQWFLVAMCIGDAATNSVFLLAITFLTDVLNFSAAQNGVAMVVLLIACIPGGLCSYWCSKRFNPVASSIVGISILLVNTALVAGLLQGPDQEILAYFLAALWGLGIGWKFTVDRMLYAMILPKSESNYSEFAGLYIFSRYCLSWLPPLLFTLLNERTDVSLQWSMASLDIFFLLTLLTYLFGVRVDRYAQAVVDAQPDPREPPARLTDNNQDANESRPYAMECTDEQ